MNFTEEHIKRLEERIKQLEIFVGLTPKKPTKTPLTGVMYNHSVPGNNVETSSRVMEVAILVSGFSATSA
jgi:hypothetical protein